MAYTIFLYYKVGENTMTNLLNSLIIELLPLSSKWEEERLVVETNFREYSKMVEKGFNSNPNVKVISTGKLAKSFEKKLQERESCQNIRVVGRLASLNNELVIYAENVELHKFQ